MSFAAAVLLVVLSSSSVAAEPWTAVVRVASDEDTALLVRVRGQSSDLPVRLEVSSGAPLGEFREGPWLAAERLAGRHQARAVLWFVREGSDVRVQVAEFDSRRLFSRAARMGQSPGSLEWSTGAEALALAARSALRAVEAGAPLGDVVELALPRHTSNGEGTDTGVGHRIDDAASSDGAALGTPSSEGADVALAEAVGSASAREGVTSPREGPRLASAEEYPARQMWLTLGGHAALDGYTRTGHQGVMVGVGLQPGRWRLRAQVLASVPTRLRDARTELTLGQHAASVWAGLPWAASERLDVEAGLGAGAVVFTRRTQALTEEVEAAPPGTMLALLMGPELRARWRMGARVGLEASMAAEVLLGRPELRYAIDGNFVSRGAGWAVRPRLGLAMVVFL
ncbi:hypothetical protein MXAN_2928 [Myxococcus xanthus DK 1622]|uniref:Uncharacterized protein n=1 Tax=Myxococcus xanthus (strain DK1622) TaxID=246197 RepID=Q1D884_MYXXD|nr:MULTISPECIES: hypothetical protein [Myxococcus]ABF88868.1 hypothetical protein MXAN_2928 [Myxococcus xanthus DK 1622]NOJ55161.1 hypothetical protein [Myxococcus xanthus]QPM82409.1 hypothetical protein I5Q59_14520 [Myxococcus xanthus]QVW71655.1 hypothetical protein JTM82_19865 [Myxococcus xanthus DZ2]QZZ50649.1 hypothetical protein MyxoNM_15680 [Myxococcus xanthus]